MIFVMGAPGLVGSDLVPLLQARGAPVRVGGRGHRHTLVEGEFEVHEVDYASEASIAGALTGCTALFLCTPFHVDQVTVEKRVLDIALDVGVEKVVKQSVPGVGRVEYPLAERHNEIEEHLRYLGLTDVILRPQPFMQDFAYHHGALIRREHRFLRQAAEGPVSWVDARDVAGVAAAALVDGQWNGETLTLTGPAALTGEEAGEIIGRVAGHDIACEVVTESQARAFMKEEGLRERDIEVLVQLHPFMLDEEAARVNDRIRQVLGRRPNSFADFAADYRAAFESTTPPPAEQPVEPRYVSGEYAERRIE